AGGGDGLAEAVIGDQVAVHADDHVGVGSEQELDAVHNVVGDLVVEDHHAVGPHVHEVEQVDTAGGDRDAVLGVVGDQVAGDQQVVELPALAADDFDAVREDAVGDAVAVDITPS